jgi:hypothetical protein
VRQFFLVIRVLSVWFLMGFRVPSVGFGTEAFFAYILVPAGKF